MQIRKILLSVKIYFAYVVASPCYYKVVWSKGQKDEQYTASAFGSSFLRRILLHFIGSDMNPEQLKTHRSCSQLATHLHLIGLNHNEAGQTKQNLNRNNLI